MASPAVIAAVAAKLGKKWMPTTLAPAEALQVVDENTGVDVGSLTAFLTVQFPVANSRQLTLGSPGSNLWKEEGAIRFVLSAVRGTGLAQPSGWCDDLAALFRGQYFDGVTTFAPSSPVIDSSNDSGGYFLLSFVVPYWFYITG